MAKANFTELTKRELKRLGYLPANVEKYNHITKRHNDLFGFIDIIGVKRNETIAIQATSKDHISHRIKKIEEHENVSAVREANWKIEVWGWYKEKNRWKYKKVDVS